ncbi:MarR family winged helix-turn-helix transcriptional regulator [Methylobacterium sp. A54F]
MPQVPSPPSTDSHRARLALTGLIIEVFRLNGDLLAAGDALVGDLGLTSARWQVLGAVALSPVPLPVAHIARNMGLTRQAVQRVVDDMRAEGLVRLEPNPHHRRAALVAMTGRGADAYREASDRQAVWAAGLAAGLAPEAVEAAGTLLRELQRRLDAAEPSPAIPTASTPRGA